IVRHFAAIELGKRTPSSGELTTLRGMVTGTDANGRMGACHALGLLKDSAALSLINQRIDKNIESNSWVRAKAAAAIREYPPATASVHRDSMLTAYTANATDPEVIVWDDPVQIANNYLSFALFGDAVYGGNNIANYTITAPKNLLYPAVKAGLKQPDSMSRTSAAQFCFDYLTLPDVQELALDIFEMISTKSQADTMWHSVPQTKGLQLLVKHKCAEGLPLALSMMDVHPAWGHGSSGYLSETMDSLKTYGDSARWTLPHLNQDISDLEDNLNPSDYVQILPQLVTTMATIDAATTSPSGIIHLLPLATPQVVTTTGAQAITLTGTSPRGAVTFTNVTAPAHGTLTGTAPNLTYTPNNGYTGPDHFNFQAVDSLTTSVPGTVSIIVGTAGTGLKGEYFNNADFTSLQLTRTDAQVNFDWGTGSPHASIGADTFSVRWSGVLLVPETGSYTFSALNSDGARLYINGLPTINQYADQSTNWNDGSPIALNEGQLVDIQMDYYENTGSAVAKLKWTGPSFAGDNGAIIGSQWLFDGTGMIRVPYAFAQSLTLLKNKPKAITLTGSAGSLTYSVVTPPTHGTLSGTAPYLTYNPAANYIGPDSFTFKTNNGTTDSAPATVSIDVIPANTFSVNFYDNGGLTTPEDRANLQLNPGMLAGLTDWLTYGWTNIQAPWAPSGPQAPATLTSNQGSTASFVFKDCRNGGPYNWSVPRTTLLGDGNGNLMDGHVNSTLDPGDGTNLFDMEVTGIPFAVYDVIFYIGANKDQYGDGTGVIKFNGGADRAFKLRPGAFDGTFTEMVDATTPGNYIVFSGMTGSSFTTQTWGTGPGGFNHIGPCGFQIREAVVADTTPPTLNGSSIDDDKSGGPVVQDTPVNYTVTFSEDMDASTVSAADFGNAGTSAVAIGTVSETSPGVFTVPVTPTSAGTLRLQVNAGAVLTDAAGNALVTTSAIIDDTTITVTSNTAPVANSQSVSTVQNTAKPITLTATDAEADPLTYTIVTQPANGSLSGTAPNVVYTPSSNYTGADSFTFKVNDGTLDSATATVSITVNPVSQITWGVATAITAASEIQGTGVSNLAGANFGITTGTTIIVPAAETGTVDVEFKSLGSGQSVTLSNGITVAVDSTWVNWGFSAANSAVTGNFGTVLDSNLGIEIGAPVSPSATFTLSGLTIGTQYQIQFFADSTGSNSQTLSGSAAMNSLNGQFVTGTFTADATTRVFTVTRNTDFAVVNAITIAKVGSPKVWNVNIGSELTTSDNFIGAATENTANSTWNNVGIVTNQALVDSTGAAGTVTLTFGGGADNLGNNTITGPEIFATWLKHSANTTPIAMTLGGLGPANTYDLVIYSDWYWQSGEPFPVTQTAGTGMSGTVTLNTRNGTQGVIPGLVEDTDPTNNSGVTGNWIRISGLTPDGSGTLAFNIGGTNAPLSGFQLVQTGNELANGAPVANDATFAVAEDTTIGASVGTVVATDPDAGDTLTYAITAGNDGSFAIDANTGDITTAAALDYETIASYALTVSATDAGGLSDAASVIITVINRNEVPVFAASLLIKANGTEASAYSGSVAGDASDPDAGDTLTFSKLSGPTWLAVASNGVLSGTPDAAAAGVNQWTVQVSDGNLAATATLQITVDALPAQTTHGATGETTPAGTIVSGSYVDTLSSDNSYERLQEIESGGKPSKRYSYFDHVWNFDLGSGGSQIVLSVEAHHSANSEGDDFVFAYPTDGVNYTNALTVTKTADNNTPQTFTLPSNLSGAIYIRASDTNQSQGKRALDSLYVDALGVEVTQ
ncbi:MAG: tandem-95 repeat protein, partial [Akkermansiaceae bacterium]|nr:tandem-95 repeat protein [Akkermansiaceae bacterium]